MRPPHIQYIITGLNRVLDCEPLLQSDKTAIRMAIAELETLHPMSDIPNNPRANDESNGQ